MKKITVRLNEMAWDAVQMVIVDSLLDNPPWEVQTKEAALVSDRLVEALREIRKALNEANYG